MDLRRLRAGEWIAALGGAVLLVSLFLPWYGPDASSGWEVLTAIDLLLAAFALFALALFVITATQRVPALPLALDALVALAGKVALALVVIRMASPPGDAEGLEVGIWLALAGALAIVAGGWVAMRDERLSESGRSTDHSGRPGPPPPEVEVIPAP
jgi:hypothetical protein